MTGRVTLLDDQAFLRLVGRELTDLSQQETEPPCTKGGRHA